MLLASRLASFGLESVQVTCEVEMREDGSSYATRKGKSTPSVRKQDCPVMMGEHLMTRLNAPERGVSGHLLTRSLNSMNT